MTFFKVAETSEIPLGQMKSLKIAEEEVLIANVHGVYYAIGNICTHAGGDLSKGTLEGTTVTCPKHKTKFDLTTGKVISGPRLLLIHPKIQDEPYYKVRIEGRDILIERG